MTGLLLRCYFPKRDVPRVPRACRECPPVRAECQGGHHSSMRERLPDRIAGIGIPQASQSAAVPGQNELAIGAESDGINTARMFHGGADSRTGDSVPLLSDKFIPPAGVMLGPRENPAAISAEGEAHDFCAIVQLEHH